LISIKRIYAPAAETDGQRVLVDRLWPRGVAKNAAQLDLWLKEAAPSAQLRKWFGHDPALWEEFKRRYEAELTTNAAAVTLRELAARGDLTLLYLLYGAHDETHNQAVVLAAFLEKTEPRG
jgi:uncharacterized protein YeaO (DUF488 family)